MSPPPTNPSETASLLPASPSPTPSLRSLSPAASTTTTSSTTTAATRRARRLQRALSLPTALLAALCAGSVTAFSLYAHTFQARLRYTQFQVNGLASAASLAMYAPVPLLGYACDRAGPAPLALGAGVVFGVGYLAAAVAYGREVADAAVGAGGGGDGAGRGYGLMVAGFVAIGVGTCAMYMSAVATCAKNFGRGRHRGLALALPIAAFGLSGMWLSQVGSRLFLSRDPAAEEGEVDVVRFFVFLAGLLVVVGVIGAFGLRIVDERDLIEEAVEELERSGFLDGSALFTPGGRAENGYGAVVTERADPFDELENAGIKNAEEEEEEARIKKQWVLNAETRRFLTDHTMWCFALGFFFMIGPGEAFINNMGTVIKTLYPPTLHYVGKPTSPATHVSIVGITSTAVRLLTGTLTDLLAPSPKTSHVQITTLSSPAHPRSRIPSVSRVSFLLFFAALLSLGLAALAGGFAQDRGDRFWIVSGLVGAGYGAVFSLTPIIITVIWGVENFATNWGIVAMFPALGATVWGLVYSAVYQTGAERQGGSAVGGESSNNSNLLCYGKECYAPAFWAMAASVWIACGLVLWAWKGKNGWAQRGIVV
ncbi:major facilitator superfamily domain-containing protein [Staphylotrichum tortipilum]|uniref:Probable transporter MCH1 n=1 Tax=Staphylotrichum tortipilum TaxID=2831512 RepID=A0AAN6MTD7_9PEZI|nr:major facilitator superfamily domain-containing protein [Staphylotrichum longicolle]